MENIKINLRPYGINPDKGRKYENIAYVLALVYNLLQTEVEKYLVRYDLSVVQFNILMLAAYQNEGKGLSQTELSKRLIASASNITKLVERSVQAQLLIRKANPQNRRENIIYITREGQDLIDQVWPGYDKLVQSLTEKIPVKYRIEMEHILKEWFLALQSK